MEDSVEHQIIAAHLREWASVPPYVELAIFESCDPFSIAQAISTFCVRYLGAPVAQPDQTLDRLGEIARVQSHLASHGVFAPEILAGLSELLPVHADGEPWPSSPVRVSIGTNAGLLVIENKDD